MRHLIPFSVYQDISEFSEDPGRLLRDIDCDGFELLTGHEPVDPSYAPYTVSVHLPYAVDWLAAWQGRPYDMDADFTRFYMYGSCREEMIRTVHDMISYAAPLGPAHGVLHASNTDIKEIRSRRYTTDPHTVLDAFAELVNAAVKGFDGGEPPFRILFENLWWPGLRLRDATDYEYLRDRIAFENWGICLDTGHLMNSLPGIRSEREGLDAVLGIVKGYPRELLDRIHAVHLHYSDSGTYRETFEEVRYGGGDLMEFLSGAYPHISMIDRHLPFTDKGCARIIGTINPDIVVHELSGRSGSVIGEYIQQRSLLR